MTSAEGHVVEMSLRRKHKPEYQTKQFRVYSGNLLKQWVHEKLGHCIFFSYHPMLPFMQRKLSQFRANASRVLLIEEVNAKARGH